VSYAYAKVRWVGRKVTVELTVHKDDAATLLLVPVSDWFEKPEFVARAGPVLADSVRRRFTIRADGHRVPLAFTFAEPDPRRRGVTLTYAAVDSASSQAPGVIEIAGPVFPNVPNHETFVTFIRPDRGPPHLGIRASDEIVEDVLTLDHPVLRIYAHGRAGALAVLRTFVPAGIHHIAIGPDHILFVLGLLLLGGGVARLLKIVSAFTVAHSITLTLAALGLVHVPSRVVEPLIALSIVFVAFETLRHAAHDRRATLAFGFGLVHGFGFASVLADLGLPRGALALALAGFNIGVEIGQLSIVLLVVPLIYLLREQRFYRPAVLHGGSALIAAIASVWLCSRAFGLGLG